MDRLFDAGEAAAPEPPADGPLAVRLRPRTLDDVVGQRHLLGEGSALRTALESGQPHSMILYGPPATRKTTIARPAPAPPARRPAAGSRAPPAPTAGGRG